MREFQDGNEHLEDSEPSDEDFLDIYVERASKALEQINIIQLDLGKRNLNVKIPRYVIRTADEVRGLLSFIDDETLKTNIAYNLMLTDFYKWILSTFGIYSTIEEMIIKELICTYGHVLEGISKYLCEKLKLKDIYDDEEISKVKDYVKKSVNDEKLKNIILSYLGNLANREVGVESALNKLAKENIVNDDLKEQLIEGIWQIRCREHLTTLKDKEYDKYTLKLANDAIKFFYELLDTLKNNKIS